MKKIIIDTDPGIDDAIAILLALCANEQVEVAALTTVNGNVDIEKNTYNACRILELAGRTDIPVYKGCGRPLQKKSGNASSVHGGDGLGNASLKAGDKKEEAEDAVTFLLEKTKREKELTLLCLGPLTNIATAIKRDGEFVSRVKEIIIMGGSEKGGNVTEAAEFNFWADPEAAEIVMKAGFENLTMIGLDATKDIWMTPVLLDRLKEIPTEKAAFMEKALTFFFQVHKMWGHAPGCELCDPLVSMYLLCPQVVTLTDAKVEIVTQGECAGQSLVYRTEQHPGKEKNARVAVSAKGELFFEEFFRYFSK